MVRAKVLGKSPAGAYIRLNEAFSSRLPRSVTESRLLRGYWRLFHALVLLQSQRTHYVGTFFFRNRAELELIRRLAGSNGEDRSVRMTILGCSNGAQVYSILWTLRSSLPALKLTVHATDISEEMLNTAREGVYPRSLLQSRSEPIFERMTVDEKRAMFDVDGDRLKVKPWMKNAIIWSIADARDPLIGDTLGQQDVVIADNFLCHMEPPEAERCLRNIARLVRSGGYLFISGVDLDVREKVAKELGWHPVPDLLEAIHDGDPSVRLSWPSKYWGLEPLDTTRRDWRVRYASVFQVGAEH
ncbi:MAG TPA: CheR family methyltransferase [Myxococcaceae bacterium]|nr:CheR family methyltransferase [Myxococcaceae bacterium]